MKTVDGKLIPVAGKSRCGKTALVAAAVKGEKRITAWDPDDQWAQLPGWRRVTSRKALLEALQKPGNFKIAYVVSGEKLQEEFNFWAGCVFYAGRYVAPLVAIAEELADVTSPGKAPGNWGILLRRGLKRGITIYPISQRWAEADKTALNNVSEFWLVSMAPMDVDYMAKKTGIPVADIACMRKIETDTSITCPWLKLEFDSGKITTGALKFKK